MKVCNLCKVLPGAFALLAALFSCVDADPTVGNDYMPRDHEMKIARDSSFVVKTYNQALDSIFSDGYDYSLLGGYKNPATGVSIDAGIVFQMQRATSFTQGIDSLYGTAAVIDSARVEFAVEGALGKTEVAQTFDLYELNEQIWMDSNYYYHFDPVPYMPDQPLATVTHSGGEKIEFWLEDEAFLRRLTDTTGYYADSLFKKRFKAFYIKPRTPHNDAAAYRVKMIRDSRLTTWYHNAEYPDTALNTTYSFAPWTEESPYTYNQTINVIDRDYTNVLPEFHLNDPDSPAAQIVVESFGGIVTRLEFTSASIDALKEKARDEGFRDIAVNKAVLQFFYPTRDPAERDRLPDRLGMYFDFRYRIGISEYDWYSEYSSALEGTSSQLSYDGAIHPSRYLYQMDITGYVQQLIRNEETPTGIILAPDWKTIHFGGQDNWSNPYTTVLSGSGSENPPVLVITYTMLR